jgi:membrane associated rhomboid family serine protease
MTAKLHKIIAYVKQQDQLNLIIGVNALLFLLAQILLAFNWFSLRYVALPNTWHDLASQPWSLITYGFFHQDLLALLFNMFLLFYFGSILIDFKSEKRLVQIYISGVLLGGLFFILSYQYLPEIYVIKSPLLGASAGVMAVITYISLLLPQYQIKIRFLGYFKLLHLLIFLILFNLLQIPLGNPGGYFAHLGGLTAGFLWFFIEKFSEDRKAYPNRASTNPPKTTKTKRVDAILDKISRSGYDSLTQAEKDELFRQSQK